VIEPDPGAARPAGFWRRALALAVDVVIFELVQFSFGVVAGRIWGAGVDDVPEFHVAVVAFTLLFTAVYTTVLHAWGGQTVGKALVGVRVVAADGGFLPLRAALLRHLAYVASIATLGFGYVMAGLRADRRALHDLLAGSRVERV
jgi:uncharacterized RDD family membrane protein YckC